VDWQVSAARMQSRWLAAISSSLMDPAPASAAARDASSPTVRCVEPSHDPTPDVAFSCHQKRPICSCISGTECTGCYSGCMFNGNRIFSGTGVFLRLFVLLFLVPLGFILILRTGVTKCSAPPGKLFSCQQVFLTTRSRLSVQTRVRTAMGPIRLA
jgi:hypothetical protein